MPVVRPGMWLGGGGLGGGGAELLGLWPPSLGEMTWASASGKLGGVEERVLGSKVVPEGALAGLADPGHQLPSCTCATFRRYFFVGDSAPRVSPAPHELDKGCDWLSRDCAGGSTPNPGEDLEHLLRDPLSVRGSLLLNLVVSLPRTLLCLFPSLSLARVDTPAWGPHPQGRHASICPSPAAPPSVGGRGGTHAGVPGTPSRRTTPFTPQTHSCSLRNRSLPGEKREGAVARGRAQLSLICVGFCTLDGALPGRTEDVVPFWEGAPTRGRSPSHPSQAPRSPSTLVA